MVNDFKTVYLARNTRVVVTVVNFDGEEKVTKSLEVFGRSTRLYIVVPFLCPFLCLTFSVVAYYLWCGTLFSRCRISVY